MGLTDAIGLTLSLIGLGIAVWQLYRTQKAMDAAREAAKEVVQTIRNIESVSSMQEIRGRSRDLMHLARTRDFAAAANAAFELRDVVSRFRSHATRLAMQNSEEWKTAVGNVVSLHERLESAAVTNRLGKEEREALIHEIGRIHSVFSSMTSTTETVGVNDAYPQRLP